MAYESLFNKNLPKELDSFLKLIDDAYEHLKNEGYTVKETKQKQWIEYGFYLYNKDKSIDIFIGLWFEMWQEKGIILCICPAWKEKLVDGNKINEILKKYPDSHVEAFDPYFVFKGFPTLSFKEKYITNITDYKNIVNKVFNIMNELGTNWK